MSKYVDQVIQEIRKHPERFEPAASHKYCRNGTDAKLNNGIRHVSRRIWVGGGGSMMVINETEMPITFMDGLRLSFAIKWWYRNVPISYLRP